MHSIDFATEFEMLSQLLLIRCIVDVFDEHTSLIAVVFRRLASLAYIVRRILLLLWLIIVLIYRKSVEHVNRNAKVQMNWECYLN